MQAWGLLHRARPPALISVGYWVTGLNREMVRAAVGFLNPDVRVSKVTAQAWQEGTEFALRALKQAPAFAQIFDIRILRQVEREHPELLRDLPPIPEALRL